MRKTKNPYGCEQSPLLLRSGRAAESAAKRIGGSADPPAEFCVIFSVNQAIDQNDR